MEGTETHRHECEVRSVLAMGNKIKMKNYMDLCEKHRGKKAADRLRADVRAELIKLREKENGSSKKPGARGSATAQQVYEQAGGGYTSEDRIKTGETGKAQGRAGENRKGNKRVNKNGHSQTALF